MLLEIAFSYVANTLGVIGVIIISFGVIRATFDFMMKALANDSYVNFVRIELGHYLALGLEMLIAKDIIDTLVNPSTIEIVHLGLIVFIRVVLSLFLRRELRDVEKEVVLHEEMRRLDREGMAVKKKK